ncbi:MAG: SpoIID/LytB domain-containing protein [Desulfovibrionaceae bacterium]
MRVQWTVCLALAFMLAMGGVAQAVDVDAEMRARWQLNYADYLVDVGKYMEAVEYLDSAYETSGYPKNRADALLSKAMVLGSFLDEPDAALGIYRQLGREFADQAQTVAYQSAFLLMQVGRKAEAVAGFDDYLRRYPSGRYAFQAEAMLQVLRQGGQITPPTETRRTPLRVALSRGTGRASLSGAPDAPVCIDGGACAATLEVLPADSGLVVSGKRLPQREIVVRSNQPIRVDAGRGVKRVRGVVRIQVADGKLRVINLVDIEAYLRSVVPAESYSSWPVETLKAQAVAARTYALYQQRHRTSREYDLVDFEGDQMYGGVERETGRTDAAVRDTAGLVMRYDGKVILSQYTANNGGYAADAGAVFGAAKPYLVAHRDAASLEGKMATWTRRFTRAEVEEALLRVGVKAPGVKALEPVQVGPSGRMIKVRVVHANGSTVLRTRSTLASSKGLKLPEVLVQVERNGDTFVFHGKGHGHGVGYSQWGAAILGKTHSYDAILAFYYPKTSLDRLW